MNPSSTHTQQAPGRPEPRRGTDSGFDLKPWLAGGWVAMTIGWFFLIFALVFPFPWWS